MKNSFKRQKDNKSKNDFRIVFKYSKIGQLIYKYGKISLIYKYGKIPLSIFNFLLYLKIFYFII